MNKLKAAVVGMALASIFLFADQSRGGEINFDLPALGGGAVSPDGTTLVVSLTGKTELVLIDTVAGKEGKRITLEFQPTVLAWGDKVIFAGQKNSGVVHIISVATGKEIATGKTESPIRNLAVVKGICFTSSTNRQVFAIDAKGTVTKPAAEGTFISATSKGDFVYTCVDGKATTDVYKYAVDGAKLTKKPEYFRSLRASLINVQGMQVAGDGKSFGVVAGGGWADQERKRHYGVPIYGTDDMKSQLGELETGAYPSGFLPHPNAPVLFACNGKEGAIYNAKTYASLQKIPAPKAGAGANPPIVLAFVGKGKKLAWGSNAGDAGVLKIYDVNLPAK
jgi:hypothetical protein